MSSALGPWAEHLHPPSAFCVLWKVLIKRMSSRSSRPFKREGAGPSNRTPRLECHSFPASSQTPVSAIESITSLPPAVKAEASFLPTTGPNSASKPVDFSPRSQQPSDQHFRPLCQEDSVKPGNINPCASSYSFAAALVLLGNDTTFVTPK